jgi:CHAT domain-containing protein/tetratricopeptide (TPR) repeat protein
MFPFRTLPAFLLVALFGGTLQAAELPYLKAARDFVAAAQDGPAKDAMKLRGANNYAPVRPFVTPPDHCRTDIAAIELDTLSASEERAHVRASIPISCIGTTSISYREVLLRMLLEKGSWRVAKSVTAARAEGEALIAMPEAERFAYFASLDDAARTELAGELHDAIDDWTSDGKLTEAEAAVRVLDGNCERLDARTLARTTVQVGKLHRYKGDFDLALQTISGGLAGCRAYGDAVCAAVAHNELGLIYIRQAKLDLAEIEMREALALREVLGDKMQIANVQNGLGIIARQRGRYAEAADYYSKSAKVRTEIGDVGGAARVLNNYGMLFAAKDDTETALRYLNHAAELFGRVGNRPRQAASLLYVGVMYRNQSNYRLALDIASRSHDVFCEIDDKYNEAIALREIGADHAGLGEWREAIRYLAMSIELSEATGFEENRALALKEMADAYAFAGRHGDALRCMSEAWDIATRDMAPTFLGRIASAMAATGENELALHYADRAVREARELGKSRDVATARTVAGEAYTFLGRFADAERAYREAIEATEKVRTTISGGERAQAHFMERRLAAYHGIVQLLVSQNRDREALRYAEQGKSRVLVDVLSGGRSQLMRTLAGPRQEEERRLHEALAHANVQLGDVARDPAERARLRQDVEVARLAYEQFEARLFLAQPRARLERGALEMTSAETLRRIVSEETTAIVEYVMTADSVIAFVIRLAGGEVRVTAHVLPMMTDSLTETIHRFAGAVAEKDLRFANGSHSLYEAVIEPIAGELAGVKRLLIVPDGSLWSLPFEALRDERDKYLVERYAIAYAPSMAAYVEMARVRGTRSHEGAQRLLAIGNPTAPTAIASQPSSTVLRDDRLAPLPESEDEVRRIAALYDGAVYIGPEATEVRLKQNAGGFDVVHVATHAVIDSQNPMYSYLVLARDAATADDGMLEAWEIANLDLRANLVVLSACETARGRHLDGEGIIGLSWAWFLAGTPAAVLSRWRVDSAATAELMVLFHENLVRYGTGEPEALRRAATTLMRDPRYRHPFYWAAFQVVGAGR